MPRYPRSVLSGTASEAFESVLRMHLPEGGTVLDPTYGDGLSWQGVGLPVSIMRRRGRSAAAPEAGVLATDLKFGYDVRDLARLRPDLQESFDVVYFDPPYFAGVPISDDPRAGQYGGYTQSFAELQQLMNVVPSLAFFLRARGKLILKCADQYHVKTRTFHALHLQWATALQRELALVDLYVYPYHRVSPTAYKVKNRPCAVVAHSYFLVGQAW